MVAQQPLVELGEMAGRLATGEGWEDSSEERRSTLNKTEVAGKTTAVAYPEAPLGAHRTG